MSEVTKKKRVYKKKTVAKDESSSVTVPQTDSIIPIILESPNKIKKIQSFLPRGKYIVLASCGHFRTFSNAYNNMGFTVDGTNVVYDYINDEKKKTIIANLKSKCKDSPIIFLATDPDREGEAIAWHIAELLGKKKQYFRIKFNSITKNEVMKALESPTQLDMNLVNAQITRMMIDKWIGFKVSPLCWANISKLAKSAGRVQSPALKILVEREREIINFKPVEYFTIQAHFKFNLNKPVKELKSKDSEAFELLEFNLKNYGDMKKPLHFMSEDSAMAAIEDIENNYKKWKFTMKENENNSHPPPPYTTLTMLQDCHTYLKMNPDHAMSALQKMYESGWITYHRTDSVVLSTEGLFETRDALKELHPELITEKPRNYTNKSLNAQEAHEPIRPTHYEIIDLERHLRDESEDDKAKFDPRIYKIYSMIYFRTLASQCKPVIHTTYNLEFSDTFKNKEVAFSKTYSYLKDLGWKQLYQDKDINKFFSKKLDDLEKVPTWLLTFYQLQLSNIEVKQYELESHHTIPPPFFTSSTLIKELESLGIGRPSTYAFILSKLVDNQYVFEKDSKLHPAPIALELVDFLQKHYDKHFMNLEYTQGMEQVLDEIAEGKSKWTSSVIKFINEFPITINKV